MSLDGRLPDINGMWRLVSYMNDILDVAQVSRDQVAWRMHPRTWRQMAANRELFRDAIKPSLDGKSGLGWSMFGYAIVTDPTADAPRLEITLGLGGTE